MRRHILARAMFATALPLGAAAQPMIQSQEGIALQNQILQLQQQGQQLQSGGGNGGGSNGGGSALGGSQSTPPASDSSAPQSSIVTSLLNQVSQLQQQVQQLNGKVDTLQNQVNTQHDATEKDIGDLAFQVNGGAPPAPGAPGATAAAPVNPGATAAAAAAAAATSTPAANAAATSPKATLHAAQEALLKGNYPAAQSNAQLILSNAKSSPQGYQAQYILAQSLYAQGKPEDSAVAFDDAYNRDRTGEYAPGSLLGLANSLTAIHQEAAACDTLASLNSQFPTPPKGLGPAITAASHRAHCS